MLTHGTRFALCLSFLLALPAAWTITPGAALAAGTVSVASATGLAAPVDSDCMPALQKRESASCVVLALEDTQITVAALETFRSADGVVVSAVVRQSGENALLMWWNDGRLTGTLTYRGANYTVATVAGQVRVELETARPRIADHAPMSLRQAADARARDTRGTERGNGERRAQRLALAIPNVAPFPEADLKALQARTVSIDLMMLYSAGAARHYMNMPDLIALAIKQINTSFRNSGLANVSLRLVHTQMIDYEEGDGEHFDHLYRMVDAVGAFQDVPRLRDEKGADIVGLIIDDASGCGLSTRVAPDAEDAYFVVHHSCAMTGFSIAHEIGHVLGARHDRHTDALDSPFPYGHGYVNGTKWRDIMSYQGGCEGCPRIPYWSNPRITYNGEPTGTDANDNARVILEQALRVSNFR
jgi:hypothetical protein